MKIGFSKISSSPGYQLYVQWLRSAGIDFEEVNLYGLERSDAIAQLRACSGLVLTGGADVHPSLYGKQFEEKRCYTNPARDELDLALIKSAIDMSLPLVAICRGCQVLNVSQGGSLIIDIETDFSSSIKHSSRPEGPAFHEVCFEPGSHLFSIGNAGPHLVSSLHHQAVDSLADCFVVAARASDGVIEGYEWADPQGKNYLLAVQWHPEIGFENSRLNRDLAIDFLNHSKAFRLSASNELNFKL